jgi:hypothetical protein
MEPNSFQFVLTLPGDHRLVGAVRDLTAHAATYAKLSSAVSQSFAQKVADEMQSAISATGIQDAPIEFRFNGTADTLLVTLSWSRNGSPETREIRQQLTS